ncbi:MAG TPA: putative peptidoglycan glycosyltransferase FtsW [Bryobacteraceae bacterium]|nr:putative peptidoglycan glycosyltransferase FtsW [Bryobacteraceae bacterium]
MAQKIKTDWILFFTVVVMVCFGIVVVFSASSVMAELKYKSSYYFISRQIFWAAVSFLVLMFFKRLDYRKFRNPVWAFAPLGVVLSMLLIAYFADPRRHRWISIGSVGLQPSEFAKPALIVFLAYFITLRMRAINNRHTLLPASLALAVLVAAVAIPDFGTALVLIVTAGVVFFVAGLERRYILLGLAGVGLLAGILIVSKPYRMARIIGYVDPEYKIISKFDRAGKIKDYVHTSLATRDPAYQARQSKIAVGTGGALGVGLMQGKQKLLYLPEAHTDFIYAVIGEELGLWGSTAVLVGFFVILWRGLRLFWIAPDDFGKYLALGVTASVVLQALINMSVVLDMGPTKGIPLPMISYGGSSLLSTLISLGLLLSVSERAE